MLTKSELDYAQFNFETVYVNLEGQVIRRDQRQATYQRLDLGEGVTLDLVLIPGGRCWMGSPDHESDRQPNEGPQHEVVVPSFWMAKYLVTQAQYEAVMGANPSTFQGYGSRPIDQVGLRFKAKNRPVEGVTWHEAVEFCDRLSQRLSEPYRLPSEAQWEYACRGGTNTAFHFGETITTDLANYHGTNWEDGGKTYPGVYGQGPKGEYRQETTDVGSFPPNAFGLYDMHGNVWEWCLDLWHDSYKDAPTDGSAWTTGNSSYRVNRGGSWGDIPGKCRSAYRNGFYFSTASINGGLRVVSLSTGA
jgi:formylglycine-generating enzyme required for sulfatase activity